jgi:hypothetical protein
MSFGAAMFAGSIIFILLISLSGDFEGCKDQCHPYAPEIRSGECYCDKESVRP